MSRVDKGTWRKYNRLFHFSFSQVVHLQKQIIFVENKSVELYESLTKCECCVSVGDVLPRIWSGDWTQHLIKLQLTTQLFLETQAIAQRLGILSRYIVSSHQLSWGWGSLNTTNSYSVMPNSFHIGSLWMHYWRLCYVSKSCSDLCYLPILQHLASFHHAASWEVHNNMA